MSPHPVLTMGIEETAGEEPVNAICSLRRQQGGPQRFCESLAQAWVSGVAVRWESLFERSKVSRVRLPSYAFQRTRYWPELGSGAVDLASLGLGAGDHPMLGAILVDAEGEGARATGSISLQTHPWLADHAVMGNVVLPGTALLELALHVGTAIGCDSVSDFTLEAPLILDEQCPTQFQLKVGEEDDDGARSLTIHSRLCDLASSGSVAQSQWMRNASGTLLARERSALEPASGLGTGSWPPSEARPVAIEGLYDRLAELGVAYGPAFQGLRALWREGAKLYAEVSLREEQREQAAEFALHPALLDATLHGFAASLLDQETRASDSESAGVRLPFSLSDVWVDARGSDSLRVCLTPLGEDTVSLIAADEAGRVLATVGSLSLRAVSEAQLRKARQGVGDALFCLDWVVAPAESSPEVRAIASIGSDAQEIQALVGAPDPPSVGETYADVAALAQSVREGKQSPVVTIVCPSMASRTGESALERTHTIAHNTLGLVQAWLAQESLSASRLLVITRNAVAARPGEDIDAAAASAWGLVRAAQAEDPGRLTLIDLDGEPASWRALAGALAIEEPQLAIRDGAVYVARLTRAGAGTTLKPPPGASDWRLQIGPQGTFEDLRLAPIQTDTPLEPGQVRVSMRAAGLNFRDVVTALGLVPRRGSGDEMIGSEGAGVVLEVGSSVRDISAGDRVMGLVFDSFATSAVVDRRMIVAMPPGWSFIEAASVCGVFLTANYALADLAEIKPGERLLVHAAAGGVGMAAVQLARRLGVEVWATASPSKWDALRGLGLPDTHIASSRDLDFKQKFLEATAGEGVDVVLNSLAREYVDASLELLPRGGRFIEMGKTDLRDPARVATEHAGVGYRAFDLPEAGPDRIQEMLLELLDLLAAGEVEPLPVRSWDLRRARDAFRFMSQARHVGKIVLTLPAEIDARGCALITGGGGELGAAVARHLVAQRGVRSLVLASRRGLDVPGIEALCAELTELGAQVRAVACDVSDKGQLTALLESIRAEGPLSVVVHSAGVLDDATIESLTPERIDRVFAPKVDAAWHLHELTKDSDLADFILFSSVAGTFGTAGQGNYAAANAFLDALAGQRQAEGLPAVSMAWGGWRQLSDMTGELSETDLRRVRRSGVSAFSGEEGLELFDAARASGEAVVVPVRLDMATLRSQARNGELAPLLGDLVSGATNRAVKPASGLLVERLAAVSEAERRRVALRFVCEEVAAVLGHSSAEAIQAERAFKELGFDSLLAVELRNRMNAASGLRLPATLVFDYPSPLALAEHLTGELAGLQVPKTNVSVLSTSDEPIAIVGMSCRYPGGVRSAADLWELVASGTDAIGAFPTDRGWDLEGLYGADSIDPDASHTREGGFVYDAGDFDADFFGISPREALAMDPQQRLLLEASWEALEDAGLDPRSLQGTSTGVFAGVGAIAYGSDAAAAEANVAAFRLTGSLGSVASGRIAYTLGLEGPAMSIDTACSSSLVALHLACGALRSGETSLALAGGVSVMSTADAFVEFSRQRGLAGDGRCKSFAASADGAGWGEGVGMLVLERLSDARRRGHRVHALVRGSAINQDGASNGLTAPNGPAQQRVIRQALANAGLSGAEVDAVEAHGTGTVLGDPIEAQALLATYGQQRERPLWLGSIKSNIAHTQLAAGAAGVIKMAMALQNELLPQTLHLDEPSPQVDWSTGAVSLLSEPVPWTRGSAPRRAGISSFGVSGTNAHVIIEEGPPAQVGLTSEPEPVMPPEQEPTSGGLDERGSLENLGSAAVEGRLVPWPLSARGEAALRDQAERLQRFVRAEEGLEISAVAASLARRCELEDRAVAIGASREQLLSGLDGVRSGELPPGVIRGRADAARPLAFLFTGQGAQRLGMGRELFQAFPVFKAALEEISAELEIHLPSSPLEVMFAAEGSAAALLLDETAFTQAALFALEVSLFRLLDSWGVRPDFLVGHSIGELSAAFLAGVFSQRDACKLVAARGALMGELPAGGIMVALQASEQEALESLAGCAGEVSLAAVNGPEAVVLSGEQDAVLAVAERWRERGRKVKRLRVSHAFHSARMDGMLDAFGEVAESVAYQTPRIPLVSNLIGEGGSEEICTPEYWVRHVRETVRFADGIGWLVAQGVGGFLEVGPDGVLAAMTAECLRDPRLEVDREAHTVVACLKADSSEERTLLNGLAELWTRGASVDWAAMLGEGERERVVLPTYPFQRRRYWLESSAPRPGASSEPSTVDSWRYEVQWKPISPPPVRASGGVWLVAPADAPDGQWENELLASLERCGLRLRTVRLDALDRSSASTEIEGVISLASLGCEGASESSGLPELLTLVQTLAEAEIDAPLWLVTRGAVSVGPSDRLDAPLQAGTWGFGMTLGLEQPQRWGGLVDLPAALHDRTVAQLVGVLCGDGDEDQLAIRSTGVFARRIVRAPVHGQRADTAWKAPAGTILLTGGTGGLGAHVARWLAETGAEHLLLTSRRGGDAPGAQELQVELESLGAAVTFAACDVSRREQVQDLLGSVEGHRPLRAVVHAAGLGSQSTIESLGSAELEQALAAKAWGALHLDELTQGLDLDAFVLFSSIAGSFGSGTQAPYAAANAILDALAHNRRARGLSATSLAWGPWSGEGLAADDAVGEALRRHGLEPMNPQLAVQALQAGLERGEAHTIVADVRWKTYAPIFALARSRPLIEDLPEVAAALSRTASEGEQTGARLRERLVQAPEQERSSVVLELVRGEVARAMGHTSLDSVDSQRPFKELGFDSLMAVELRNRLERATGLGLAATLVFDYPSPLAVADHLRALLTGSEESGATPLEAEMAALERGLASLGAGPKRSEVSARLRDLLAGLGDELHDSSSERQRAGASLAERMESASDEEIFGLIDNELGGI